MGTTANGLVYPELTGADNVPADMHALAAAIDTQYGLTVATAADLAGVTSPFPGMRVWVTADATDYTYTGTTWVGTSGEQHASTTTPILTPLASTVLSNVAGYAFDTVPGIYAIDAPLFLLNAGSSGVDMKFGWAWTGTGVMTWGIHGLDTSVAAPDYNGPFTAFTVSDDSSTPADTSTGVGTPAGIPVAVRIMGTFECTAAGAVQLQFAQFVSNPTYAGQITHGSRMAAKRIA